MIIYDLARKAKSKYKIHQKKQAGRFLSPVRRIERVAPPSDARYVAMTFDDGPSSAHPNPKISELGLTEHLLSILNKYNAKGTFDVIGTTENNYPDVKGKEGSFSWGGIRYDHYPDIGSDVLAGVKNQPALAARMINEGHEITSHGYAHILFGKIKLIYGKRAYFNNVHEVIADLQKLDDLVSNTLKYKIRASRPPHYVDKTRDGHSAYDAYRYLNYQYLAASFDGGGWQVRGDYENEVSDMITPLKSALESDPNSLNGQIVFQKDGCNMSRRTPVASALEQQLELLTKHNYRVVTVSELIKLSPFEDAGDTDPVFESARALISEGFCVAYKNNTLNPDRLTTLGELVMMSVPPAELHREFCDYVDGNFHPSRDTALLAKSYGATPAHPYFHAFSVAIKNGYLPKDNPYRLNADTAVTEGILFEYLHRIKREMTSGTNSDEPMKRREVLHRLACALL